MLRPSTEFVVNLTCNPWINIAGSNALKSKNLANNGNVILVTSRKPSVNPSTSALLIGPIIVIASKSKLIIVGVIVKSIEVNSPLTIVLIE